MSDSKLIGVIEIKLRVPACRSQQWIPFTDPAIHRSHTPPCTNFCNRNVHTCAHFYYNVVHCGAWWVQIVGYVLACRSCSSLCKLIWRLWTYKMPVRYILSSVWVRLSIFSQLSIIQYIGLCVFSLPSSLVMIEITYTLSYYHHQNGSMNYYRFFRARSWNNGLRCMSLYILVWYLFVALWDLWNEYMATSTTWIIDVKLLPMNYESNSNWYGMFSYTQQARVELQIHQCDLPHLLC